MQTHGIQEELPEPRGRVGHEVGSRLQVPVPRDREAGCVDDERMRRRQVVDALEERLVEVVGVPLFDEVANGSLIGSRIVMVVSARNALGSLAKTKRLPSQR